MVVPSLLDCVHRQLEYGEVVVVGLNLNFCSIIKYIHDNSAADLSNFVSDLCVTNLENISEG
ncbi:hypothetical protein CFP56_007191 [Quercus suber]|uniref:Uncharacterized protein n=1 Tax=Quercus suber TaxID=58331 RepID=A0AAW0L7Z0_QUESU